MSVGVDVGDDDDGTDDDDEAVVGVGRLLVGCTADDVGRLLQLSALSVVGKRRPR